MPKVELTEDEIDEIIEDCLKECKECPQFKENCGACGWILREAISAIVKKQKLRAALETKEGHEK